MKYLSERLKAFQANCDVRSAEHAIIPVFKKNPSCLLIFFSFYLLVKLSNSLLTSKILTFTIINKKFDNEKEY